MLIAILIFLFFDNTDEFYMNRSWALPMRWCTQTFLTDFTKRRTEQRVGGATVLTGRAVKHFTWFQFGRSHARASLGCFHRGHHVTNSHYKFALHFLLQCVKIEILQLDLHFWQMDEAAGNEIMQVAKKLLPFQCTLSWHETWDDTLAHATVLIASSECSLSNASRWYSANLN